MPKVNYERMRELGQEVSELQRQGLWNRESYLRINTLALEAGGQIQGARDWLRQAADPAWLAPLKTDLPSRVQSV